jgi:sirohydrochlorin ferrochelatase
VLAVHGSADPGFAAVVDDIAAQLHGLRAGLDVRIGYLDHGPDLGSVSDAGCVIVPLLLTGGYHLRADIPSATNAVVAAPVGPDRRLTTVLARRLREAHWDGERPLVLAAAGSADDRALADVHQTARDLGDLLGLDVPAAFLSAGEPRLADVSAAAVATYLLGPGRFADTVRGCGAGIVAAPLGSDPLIAEVALDRYDAAGQPGRTAPM